MMDNGRDLSDGKAWDRPGCGGPVGPLHVLSLLLAPLTDRDGASFPLRQSRFLQLSEGNEHFLPLLPLALTCIHIGKVGMERTLH